MDVYLFICWYPVREQNEFHVLATKKTGKKKKERIVENILKIVLTFNSELGFTGVFAEHKFHFAIVLHFQQVDSQAVLSTLSKYLKEWAKCEQNEQKGVK